MFPDKTRSKITKGVRLLEKTVSLTICEAIAKYTRHRVIKNNQFKRHHELFFDKSLRYELLKYPGRPHGFAGRHWGGAPGRQPQSGKSTKASAHANGNCEKLIKMEARFLKQGNTMPGYALERAERLLGWESVQALLREAQRSAVATNEPEQLSFLL